MSTLYEGGIREPLLVRWPGRVAPSTVRRTPVSSIDFYPTLCRVAGATPDPRQQLDGTSLQPLLKNPEARLPRSSLFWHYPLEKPNFLGGRPGGAIRQGDWKLIEWFDTGAVELYDPAEGPGEQHDLADRQAEKREELLAALTAWRRDVGATIPAGQPCKP